MSTNRTKTCERLVKGPNGRNLCRYCSTEVSPPRRTFCSDKCVHEFSIRSNPGYAAMHVYKRDEGVCAICGVDCDELSDRWNSFKETLRMCWGSWYCLPKEPEEAVSRVADILKSNMGRGSWGLDRRICFIRFAKFILAYPWVYKRLRGSFYCLWEMDHIKPVVEGGGECGLDNLRTLCRQCHLKETRELHKRLKEKKKRGIV